jgi:hypothetical protein
MTQAVVFQESEEKYGYLRDQVLLDSQSTADILCNSEYLDSIRTVQDNLTVYTNVGVLTCNTKGDLKGYGTVWYHSEAIAKILSLSNVLAKERYRVSFEATSGFKMRNTKTGATTFFERDKDGLLSAPLGPETNQKYEAHENNSLCAGVEGDYERNNKYFPTVVIPDENPRRNRWQGMLLEKQRPMNV